ncbi:MAG: hypothetical protein AAGE43_01350 [Pseudomonadota bacterium]
MFWKKFRDGMVFGAGFALSLCVVSYLFFSTILTTELSRNDGPLEFELPQGSVLERPPKREEQFRDLTVEERIATSTVVANVVFTPGQDDSMRAVIQEILKLDEGTTFYYEEGDELPTMSFYPNESHHRGDGAIVFFIGSPATIKHAVYYTGQRIGGLGDMPLELLKEKCAETDNGGSTPAAS